MSPSERRSRSSSPPLSPQARRASPSSLPKQAPDGPAARAGMTLAQYDWHVRDMAKSVLHVPAIYALAQVAGFTKLLSHPVFEQPGTGGWLEAAAFICGFLGAWATFYSTLLRDAGLRSWTVTFLVPAAVLAAAAVWALFPAVAAMSRAEALVGAALLCGPGPIAWIVTMIRWRIEKRRVAAYLAGTRPW